MNRPNAPLAISQSTVDLSLSIGLMLLAGGLYLHTLWHGFVLDDRLVITEHEHVMKGLEGIPEIMTSDAYASLYGPSGTNTMTGGRYRPLSQVTFALENELLGVDPADISPELLGDKIRSFPGTIPPPWIGHAGNILLYMLVVLAGFLFLRRLFNNVTWASWAAAFGMLLFAVHPLHSEVVANIKSRDELLSLLFLLLALTFSFRHIILCTLCAALALFSKEYGILLPLLLPMLAFVKRPKAWRAWSQWILVCLAIAGYLYARHNAVGFHLGESSDFAVNAYAAIADDPVKAICSKIMALGVYLKLMVWPDPLLYSYAYNHLPFVGPADWQTWVSLAALVLLAIAGLVLIAKRHPLGFLLLFALGCLFLVSNIAFSSANVVAERLAFHASFGFCGAVGWMVARSQRNPIFALAVVLAALLGWLSFDRARDWESMRTLYLADADKAPNCAVVQSNAGAIYFDRYREAVKAGEPTETTEAALENAHQALMKATEVYPSDAYAHMNLGLIHYEKGDLERAEESWRLTRSKLPNHPKLPTYLGALSKSFRDRGVATWRSIAGGRIYGEARTAAVKRGLSDLERAALYSQDDPEVWYWLHGAYIEAGEFENADMIRDRVGGRAWTGFR